MYKYLITTIIALLSTQAKAQSTTSLDTTFSNFTDVYSGLMDVLAGGAYLIGIWLTIKGILQLVELSKHKHYSIAKPLSSIGIGTFILFIVSSVDMVAVSIYGASAGGGASFLMPAPTSMNAQVGQALKGVLLFVNMVGFIGFIRGFLLLHQAGQGKDGVIGRGLTHIVGGALAMNATLTAHTLASTFGWNLPF